jgi:hypothetical protein
MKKTRNLQAGFLGSFLYCSAIDENGQLVKKKKKNKIAQLQLIMAV